MTRLSPIMALLLAPLVLCEPPLEVRSRPLPRIRARLKGWRAHRETHVRVHPSPVRSPYA